MNMTIMRPTLEETFALVRPMIADQFGSANSAVIEGLALVLATQFDAERLKDSGRLYEVSVVESDLGDMWEAFGDSLSSIRRHSPPVKWN